MGGLRVDGREGCAALALFRRHDYSMTTGLTPRHSESKLAMM